MNALVKSGHKLFGYKYPPNVSLFSLEQLEGYKIMTEFLFIPLSSIDSRHIMLSLTLHLKQHSRLILCSNALRITMLFYLKNILFY